MASGKKSGGKKGAAGGRGENKGSEEKGLGPHQQVFLGGTH